MHFTCRQMATQNGVKSSASSDKTSELSNWSLHPKDPLIRIIERHFFWVHTAVETQAPCVINYMHQGAWRFICSILRGCRNLRSLCVPHIHIISLPESCKEHFDPAAPHWSHVLFLRQDFQTVFQEYIYFLQFGAMNGEGREGNWVPGYISPGFLWSYASFATWF